MRWDDLFADLDAQFDALQSAELAGEVADRTRRERARIRLVDRLRASAGGSLTIRLRGLETLTGRLDRVGPDWLLLSDASSSVVVPLTAVSWTTGLSERAEDPATEGRVAARLGLAFVLRGISRDRAVVTVGLFDGGQLQGTIDRVGSDHVDLADHDSDMPRRPQSVRAVRSIPFAAMAYVRHRS